MTDVQKRVAVGALIRNRKNEMLIVKPSYKDTWLLVGGMVESSESPTEALKREIEEEVNLNLEVGRLLCVDYGLEDAHSINFVFDCGIVEDATGITCPENEIEKYAFVSQEHALKLLGPKGVRRISAILDIADNKTIVYLENAR